MLVDDVEITVEAGKGGPGAVAFDTSKGGRGPSGGNGAAGGSVIIEGVADLTALKRYRHQKSFEAQDGERGGKNKCSGKSGADLVLQVPVGTVIYPIRNLTPGEQAGSNGASNLSSIEILSVGQMVPVAKGGNGGWGNNFFKSSTNTSPRQFQPGLPGEKFNLRLELRLIADVGLIGLPNAGKSSLLNALTRASAKVASYPFTTLEPNLGVFYHASVLKASDTEQRKAAGLVLADIPGLIEGASTGKGLGVKFLKHIKRTRYIVHCISSEVDDPERAYQTIRQELQNYDPELTALPEVIIITKTDLLESEEVVRRVDQLKDFNSNVITATNATAEGMDQLKRFLEEEIVKRK